MSSVMLCATYHPISKTPLIRSINYSPDKTEMAYKSLRNGVNHTYAS